MSNCEVLATKSDISAILARLEAIERKIPDEERMTTRIINAVTGALEQIRQSIVSAINDSRLTVVTKLGALEALVLANIRTVEAGIQELGYSLRSSLDNLRDIILAAISALREILLELIRRFFDPNGDQDFDYERIEKAINGAHVQTRTVLGVKIDTLHVLLQTILAFLKVFKVEIDYEKIRSIVEAAHQDTRGYLTAKLDKISEKLDEILRKIDFGSVLQALQTILALLEAIRNFFSGGKDVDYERIEKAINGAHVQTRTLILEAIGRAVEHLIEMLKGVKLDYNRIEAIVSKHHAATRAFIAGLFNNFKLPPVNLLEVLNKLDRLESLMNAGIGSILSLLNTIYAFLKTFTVNANVDYQRIEKAINGAHVQTRTIILQSISNGVQYLAELIQGLKLSVDYDRIKRLIDKAASDVQNYIYDRFKNAIDYSRIQKIVDDSNAVNRTQLISLIGAYGGAILKAISDAKSSIITTTTATNNSINENGLIQKIYRILGGDRWNNAKIGENKIRVFGNVLFGEKTNKSNEVVVTDLFDFICFNTAIVYQRMGLNEFPASLPQSLISKDEGWLGNLIPNENVQKHNFAQYFQWYIERFDELMGQWEIPIEIKDSDPTTPGNQPQGFKLPNLAEAIAEMFMLLMQVSIDSQTALNIATRMMIDAGQDKQQNFITYKLVDAVADYLGFNFKYVEQEMPLMFNPGKSSYSEILQHTKIKVGVPEYNEKLNLQADLMRFRKAASILDSTHFRKINPNGDIKAQILERILKLTDLVKDTNQKDSNEAFEQFLEDVERGFTNTPGVGDPTKPYGKDYEDRPRFRNLTALQNPEDD